jgi:ParB/RepB/Spo0J family partition protein
MGSGGIPGREGNLDDALEVKPSVQQIAVDRIRPEEGLGRKRDRIGHKELCRSIAQFGVLTPVTVRPAPGSPGEFFLIKGQGRTLACRILGLPTIPAIVVNGSYSESAKVQQFLVENVARLRMKPIDRALLIAHARASGEETSKVAIRFGISAVTVRRLEAQLDGASPAEIAALRRGDVSLATQAVIARFIDSSDRASVVRVVASLRVSAAELQTLLLAVGWSKLARLGPTHREGRLRLLEWACATLASLPKGSSRIRMRELAARLPHDFPGSSREGQQGMFD